MRLGRVEGVRPKFGEAMAVYSLRVPKSVDSALRAISVDAQRGILKLAAFKLSGRVVGVSLDELDRSSRRFPLPQ